MSNIVEFVKNQVSDKVVEKLHTFLGIPEEKIHRGLDSIIPAIVGSISDHAGKENGGLMDLLKPFMGDDFDFGKLAGKSGGLTDLLHTGHTLLGGLFGDGLNDAVKAVAKSASLDDHVAGKLMRLAAPGVASGVVEGLGSGAGLSELKSALGGHLEAVKDGIPDGLGFTAAGLAALGLAGVSGVSGGRALTSEAEEANSATTEVVTEHVKEVKAATDSTAVTGAAAVGAGALRITVGDTAEVEKAHAPVIEVAKAEPVKPAAFSSAGSGSTTPVSSSYGADGGDQKTALFAGFFVMLALLGAAAYWGLNLVPAEIEKDRAAAKAKEAASMSPDPTGATAPETNSPATNTPAPEASAKPGDIQVEIDGGVKLNAAKDGIEYKLVDFIKSSKPVDKTTWFSFDRLYFDTAKSTLKPESKLQLDNIVAIMKAYPKVKLKIGGYTDNTGNDAANMKLSTDRANATMSKLIELGVAKDRLAAEGYGKQFPVASNDTEEGRAKNRRIDVRVSEK